MYMIFYIICCMFEINEYIVVGAIFPCSVFNLILFWPIAPLQMATIKQLFNFNFFV